MASAIPTKAGTTVQKGLPDLIVDKITRREYVRGNFLGKGGFAKCYEFTDRATNIVYAGKVVSKAHLMKPLHKQKIHQEIQIHRSLDHKNIVGFNSYFEDEKNVYIILELCNRRSLMEMHRRRKILTEAEARYFLHQLLLACHYLVQQKVIHRDLKLANLLLNDKMELKVGDFGLAIRLQFDGEKRRSLCGTPNYVAPEVLSKKGHSFEVDIWSVGCILFTLLVGHPPFETPTLKETYARIKRNEYRLPSSVSSAAKKLIRKLLHPDPERRPNVEAILKDEFMFSGPLPSRLPTSCLTTEPRNDTLNANLSANNSRKPLLECNVCLKLGAKVTPIRSTKKAAKPAQCPEPQQSALPGSSRRPAAENAASEGAPHKAHLAELQRLLTCLVNARPPQLRFERPDEAEDPASVPVFWLSKWLDYTDKYGLGYQLCDNSVGVVYNDNTKLILLGNGQSVTYVDEDCIEHYHTLQQYPPSLEKKITLLNYFCNYMKQYLLTTGADVSPRECDNLVRLPCVRRWLRTPSAMAFYLTNGTLQINFFRAHTKLILCPLMAAVTYIDEDRVFHTYRLQTLHKGCPPELLTRLKYAREVIDQLADVLS